MVRFFAALVLELLANSVGLLVASATIGRFTIDGINAFISGLLVYSGVKLILGPFVTKMALRYIPAFRGGVALINTFVALLAAAVIPTGFSIRGFEAWLLGTLIVWLFGVLASLILPLFIFTDIIKKEKAEQLNEDEA